MTRDDYEREAQQVAAAVREHARLQFQKRNPHYTPPPVVDDEPLRTVLWACWREANRRIHGGEEACRERFGALWDEAYGR